MRTRPTGFTLIELMIVIAIVGLLASVAVPSFQDYQLRSRAAERLLFVSQIHRAVDAYVVQHNRFPRDLGWGGMSFMWCPPNPAGAPGPIKRNFQLGVADWNQLAAVPEGALYYQYQLWGWGWGAGRTHNVQAMGDVDGDGFPSTISRAYNEAGGVVTVNEVHWGSPVEWSDGTPHSRY